MVPLSTRKVENTMKTNVCRIVAIVILIAIQTAVASTAPQRSAGRSPKDTLIAALIVVESQGDDRAIGDKHMKDRAYGCLQVRQPCVDDVNQRFGTAYRSQDMLGNRSLSVWVCGKYLERYATRKALGREPTLQDMARIWNGGPSGWKKDSTLGYWSKVQKALAKLK